MDYSLYKDVNGLSGPSFPDHVFKFLANDGIFISIAFVALLFLVPWSRRRVERRAGAVTGTIAAGVALLIGQLVSHVVDRTRPFVALNMVSTVDGRAVTRCSAVLFRA